MRTDPVLVVAGAAALGGLFVAAPWATVCAAVAALVVLGRRLSPRARILSVAALGVGAARAAIAVPVFEADLEVARAALGAPARCGGTAVVRTSPVRRGDGMSYVASFDELDCEGRHVGRSRVRLHGGPPDLARGDRITVVAQLAPVELFRNAELADPTPRAARSGVVFSGGALAVHSVQASDGPLAFIDRERSRVRARIDRTFAPAAAPLARALVLGESDLSEDDDAAFRASGLSHLLAVSGTHLVFAVLGIVQALSFVLARVQVLAARYDVARFSAAFGALLAPLYADFAGGSGSAWRAALMLTAGLGARAAGRRPLASRSFAFSLLLGAAADPLVAFDVSFVLSAAATAGLIAIGQPLARVLLPEGANVVVRALGSSVIATVSAMLPCAPLLAMLGPSLTLAGIVANVVAGPFGEVVSLPLCLLHAVLPFDLLAHGIGMVASGALLVVRAIAHASAAVTWLAVPVPPPGAWHHAALGVGALGALAARARPWTTPGDTETALPARSRGAAWLCATAIAVACVELRAVRAGNPKGLLRVTVLDVGQGDSELVDLPDGTLVLVDGGGFVGSPVDPGRSVIVPLLRERRRGRVDIAVLSHPHPDHFLGLRTALSAVDVGELWDTGQGREQGAGPEYAAMIADLRRRRVPIRGPETLCGPSRQLGGATISVLAPCPRFDPSLGANDNSLVISIRHGRRAALLTGDAEHEAEERLVAEHGGELRADLLKVGHHGSRTSTSPELLDRVRPTFATVSCGVRNRFGHPHAPPLAALRAAGVTVLRTDRFGSVEWRTDGDAATVDVFGESFRDRLATGLW